MGFRHPAVILREELCAQLTDEGLNDAMLHQSTHSARYDDWLNLIARPAERGIRAASGTLFGRAVRRLFSPQGFSAAVPGCAAGLIEGAAGGAKFLPSQGGSVFAPRLAFKVASYEPWAATYKNHRPGRVITESFPRFTVFQIVRVSG